MAGRTNLKNKYHETRIAYDLKRKVAWQTLVESYFAKFTDTNSNVLEVGAGYCDFINEIPAKKKWALDIWPGIKEYANNDVTCLVGDIKNLDQISDNSLDLVFASNIFEHITKDDLSIFLDKLRNKLKKNGKLIILQPNFKRCAAEYFDDYTHISIWSDVSLNDFLKSKGYKVIKSYPGFLPLSLKSKLPVIPFLIKIYLLLPFKPFAKQMLFISQVE